MKKWCELAGIQVRDFMFSGVSPVVVAAGAMLVVPSVLGGGVGVGVSAGVLVSVGRSCSV